MFTTDFILGALIVSMGPPLSHSELCSVHLLGETAVVSQHLVRMCPKQESWTAREGRRRELLFWLSG